MSFHLSFELNLWACIFAFSVLSMCILVSALCFTLCMFHTSARSKNISTRFKVYSVLSLSCFILAQLFFHLYTACIKLPNGTISATSKSLFGIYSFFWSAGYCCIYMLMYERLRTVFQKSVYRLTKVESSIFFSLLVGYFFAQLWNTYIWMCYVFDVWTWSQCNFYYHIALWLRFSIDWLLNLYVIILFCEKILQLTVIKGTGFQNNHSHKVFRCVHVALACLHSVLTSFCKKRWMIKYFLLATCTVLSTQLFTASDIVASGAITHAENTGEFDFYYVTYAAAFLMGSIDSLVSMCFILFSFPFSKRCYNRCCRRADAKCVLLWSKVHLPPADCNTEKQITTHTVAGEDAVAIDRNSEEENDTAVDVFRTMSINLQMNLGEDYEYDTVRCEVSPMSFSLERNVSTTL